MDGVNHEKSKEQRKQSKQEDFGEMKTTREHDRRPLSEQERIEHEMTHLPFRSVVWENIAIFGGKRTSDRTVLNTVVPKRSTAEWICRRLMAWMREIGLSSWTSL